MYNDYVVKECVKKISYIPTLAVGALHSSYLEKNTWKTLLSSTLPVDS